jgi:enoyl-CoA hydratase/carnithine racemase
MDTPISYEQDGPIATITINLPHLRNAISDDDTVAALVGAVERLNDDLSVHCAILTGAGTAFSSGGNLRKLAETGSLAAQSPAQVRRRYKAGIQRLPLAFETLEVPIIAAVNGPAIGAGCDLACMCDIRIAAESARFAESFVKLGIIPGDGGAWLLPRVVGFSKACEMTFTGDLVDAQEALTCGLVSRVVPDSDLMTTARTLADRIAANPPQAVRMAKRLLREGRKTELDTLLEISAAMQTLAHGTDDHKEAISAVLAKRAPSFTGR